MVEVSAFGERRFISHSCHRLSCLPLFPHRDFRRVNSYTQTRWRTFRCLTFSISHAWLLARRMQADVNRPHSPLLALTAAGDIVTMFVNDVEIRCEDYVIEKLCRVGFQFRKPLFM